MNLEIDGVKVTVPLCSCGKCIIRRQRYPQHNLYSYSKNMGSSYLKDYDLKDKTSSPKYLNRSIRNCFNGSYREHLPAGLMSTMKFDFKPYRIKLEESKAESKHLESFPFLGRSSYNTFFPSYGSASNGNNPKEKLPNIFVPFRGNSNYLENYKKYESELYKNRDPTLTQVGSLNFKGFMSPESTGRDKFRPIDLNQPHYFSSERPKKCEKERAKIIPANYPNGDQKSTYENFYSPSKQECELAVYLTKKGLKALEF